MSKVACAMCGKIINTIRDDLYLSSVYVCSEACSKKLREKVIKK